MYKETNKRSIVKGNGLRAQLLRGGIGSLAVRMFNSLIVFALTVLLARTMGAEGFGVYSFSLAVILLLAIPSQVGIPELLVRETAKAQANKDWPLLRGLWRWGNLAVFSFSFLSLLLAMMVIFFIVGGEDSQRIEVIVIGLVLIPLMALGNVRSACMRGLRRMVLGQLPDSVVRPGILLLLVFITSLYFTDSTLIEPRLVITLYVLASFIALLLSSIMLKKTRPIELKRVFLPRYESHVWWKAVLPLALISGLQLVNSYADIIVLGLFHDGTEVGIYRAVIQLSLLVSFGLQAINQVLHPHFSRLYVLEDYKKLQKLVTVSARVILLLSLPPVLLFIVYGEEVLSFLFGNLFYAGGIALAILALGQLVNTSMGSVGALLNMTGHERYTVRGVAVAAIINVILNFLLIPTYGMEGAAIATAVSMVIWNLLLRYYVRQKLGIESSGLLVRLK